MKSALFVMAICAHNIDTIQLKMGGNEERNSREILNSFQQSSWGW